MNGIVLNPKANQRMFSKRSFTALLLGLHLSLCACAQRPLCSKELSQNDLIYIKSHAAEVVRSKADSCLLILVSGIDRAFKKSSHSTSAIDALVSLFGAGDGFLGETIATHAGTWYKENPAALLGYFCDNRKDTAIALFYSDFLSVYCADDETGERYDDLMSALTEWIERNPHCQDQLVLLRKSINPTILDP